MNKDTINHPLEKDFLLSKVRQGNHENMEKDYGKMGQLKTEQENKNFKKWGSNALKDMRLGDNYHDKENIAPEVTTVFFTLPEAGNKKTIFQGFEFAYRQVEMNKKKGDKSQANLFIPHQVQIDYSEYSDVPKFKDNIFAKPYKDGIMLVTDVEKGNHSCLALGFNEKAKLDRTFTHGKIVVRMFKESFHNFGQIDWNHKNFDNQLVFYVVVPKIVKNKAARIVFKNNIQANKLIKFFRSKTIESLPPGKFKYFYDSTAKAFQVWANLVGAQKDETLKKNELFIYSNRQLLDAGYKSALKEQAILGGASEINDCWKFLEAYEKKSLEEIKQEYMKDIFPLEQSLEWSMIKNLDHTDKRYLAYFKKNLLKMVVFYYHTNKGTTLCNNTLIDIENKTQSDCLLFWKKVNLCELLFNVLNKYNFPLCMRNSQIINNVDIYDSSLNTHMAVTPDDYTRMQEDVEDKKTFKFKNKHIVVEAMESQTGYLMPYDGVWEIPHDLTFSSLKFREYEDFITVLLFDHEERYFIEIFSKTEVDFKYMLWNQFKLNDNYSEDCLQEIYTKIAVCIRDSKVLIDRDSTMQYQGRRKPYGSNTDSIYEIWMPRRRYHRKYSKTQAKQDKDFFAESRVFSGSRRAHPRRLPAGSRPSKVQLLLAKNENMILNPGETYVKQSMWGDKAMPQREVRYRHRSLSGNFYFDNKELDEAKKLGSMSGPQFEEYCDKYISERGWKIYKRKNYDGGIDLRAWNKEGPIKTLLIQCKHWNTPIPPGEMRAFKASCDEEKVQGEKVLMFMSFGKYSPGARQYAEKYNIELIEGDHFLNDEKI